MEITHYNNSFVKITSGKIKLICDPWIATTKENLWILDLIHHKGLKILKQINLKYIYISYLHLSKVLSTDAITI